MPSGGSVGYTESLIAHGYATAAWLTARQCCQNRKRPHGQWLSFHSCAQLPVTTSRAWLARQPVAWTGPGGPATRDSVQFRKHGKAVLATCYDAWFRNAARVVGQAVKSSQHKTQAGRAIHQNLMLVPHRVPHLLLRLACIYCDAPRWFAWPAIVGGQLHCLREQFRIAKPLVRKWTHYAIGPPMIAGSYRSP